MTARPEFDEHGDWIGPCDACGTNHDGYPPDTFGGKSRCLRAQAVALNAPQAVLDRLDETARFIDRSGQFDVKESS